MKKFKYSTIRTINNKVCFSTKSRVYADKNIYFERNKHITDNSTKIEAVSSSPVNKNLTSDELIDELEKNKQQLHNNMSSAYNLIEETDILWRRIKRNYDTHKPKLTDDKQDLADSTLAANNTKFEKNSDIASLEEKSLFDISRSQKKLTDGIFRLSFLKENLEQGSSNIRNKQLTDSENTIKEFNSLSSNITNLLVKRSAIQKELETRDNSSYFPQDSSDVVQDDFSPFDYNDD